MPKRTLAYLARWLLLALLLVGPSLAAIPAQAHSPVAPPQRSLYRVDGVPNGLTPTDWSQIQALLPPVQQAYLKASNTGVGDFFGISVAVSASTVVVGAPYEDSNATGVDGDQADNSAPNAGAAYVFIRSGTTWSQQAYLKASNTERNDWFGWSVAVSASTVVVGATREDSNATGVDGDQADNSATDAGAAYVFVRGGSGTTWSQQAYLKASNTEAMDYFGRSVAVSASTVVVGAPGEDSNATGVNGDQADNSAESAGAAYVFVPTFGVYLPLVLRHAAP
jgi:FG-GAP repeat